MPVCPRCGREWRGAPKVHWRVVDDTTVLCGTPFGEYVPIDDDLRDALYSAREAQAAAGRALDGILREEQEAYWRWTRGGGGYTQEDVDGFIRRRDVAQAEYDAACVRTEQARLAFTQS